jgi:hypothetical protein
MVSRQKRPNIKAKEIYYLLLWRQKRPTNISLWALNGSAVISTKLPIVKDLIEIVIHVYTDEPEQYKDGSR